MTATIPDGVNENAANGNEQAFADAHNHGLSKREFIAAMAMQGLLAATDDMTADEIAKGAVANADALLAELAK